MLNEIKRLQQLAGIITEIKVNNPNELDQVIEDFAYEDNVNNEDTWDYDGDKLFDIVEKYPSYFGINFNDAGDFIDEFRSQFHSYVDYDDFELWKNPTLRQLINFVKKYNIGI